MNEFGHISVVALVDAMWNYFLGKHSNTIKMPWMCLYTKINGLVSECNHCQGNH